MGEGNEGDEYEHRNSAFKKKSSTMLNFQQAIGLLLDNARINKRENSERLWRFKVFMANTCDTKFVESGVDSQKASGSQTFTLAKSESPTPVAPHPCQSIDDFEIF